MTDAEKAHFKQAYRDLISRAYYNKPGDLMIIKNPINTGRMKLLHELYPHAKWIHIHRNPYTVYRSTVKFFTELLPTLWFETVSDKFVRDLVLDIYPRLYKDFDDAVASIPDLQMVEVKFEDFRAGAHCASRAYLC